MSDEVTLGDIRRAMDLVRDTRPKPAVYLHHPLCLEKGPWHHFPCPLSPATSNPDVVDPDPEC